MFRDGLSLAALRLAAAGTSPGVAFVDGAIRLSGLGGIWNIVETGSIVKATRDFDGLTLNYAIKRGPAWWSVSHAGRTWTGAALSLALEAVKASGHTLPRHREAPDVHDCDEARR